MRVRARVRVRAIADDKNWLRVRDKIIVNHCDLLPLANDAV